MSEYLGPPDSTGWWWLKDNSMVTGDPFAMSHWDGKTLRLYTPTEPTREWSFEWDGEYWACVNDENYSEVEPVEWLPIESPWQKPAAPQQDLQDAVNRLRNLTDSDLFTVEENGDKRSLGSKGVGISWAMWRDIRRVVLTYLDEHKAE